MRPYREGKAGFYEVCEARIWRQFKVRVRSLVVHFNDMIGGNFPYIIMVS